MILLDVNVLVAAARDDATAHGPTRRWLMERLEAEELVGLPVTTVLGYLRIATHRRIFDPPTALEDALTFVDALLRSGAALVDGDERYWTLLRSLLLAADARGDFVPDGHLAALARQHGASLATRDRGLARFPGIRLVDPAAT